MIGKQVHRIFYKNHVPTTPLQKLSLAVLSSLNVFTDPTKANDLATLGEVTGHAALGKMHEKMCEDPVGRVILHEKPLVAKDTVDVSKLLQYPKGTFGRAYAEFLNKHGYVYLLAKKFVYRFYDTTDLILMKELVCSMSMMKSWRTSCSGTEKCTISGMCCLISHRLNLGKLY